VLSCPDLRGLAALSGLSFAGATVGPVQMTDGLGRKFWRFEGAAYLLIANALNALSARGVTVMLAMRHHRALAGNWFSPRYSAYTSDATNTTYSGGSTFRTVVTASAAPLLHGAGISAASARHVTGSQMQIAGVASRTTANGGQRIYMNNDAVNVAQSSVTSANCAGGVIGGIPAASNAVTASGNFDLYEFALWRGELTNAQADAAAAAMVSNWSIPAIVNGLLLEGDSITQGTGLVTSGLNIAMRMTEPGGASVVPAGWRVLNQGTSGNTVANVLSRRDAASSAASLPLPGGRNIVLCQIGRNDIPTRTGAAVYADIAALFNTTTTGFLQRGWEVRQAVNIAVSSSLEAENNALRSALRNTAQFRADTLSGTGQTYEGRTGIIDLPLWTVAGDTIFDTVADAADANWFAGDSTHPGVNGAIEMAQAYVAGLAL
jgi:lysophospholipase L1-like esterase